MVVRIGINPLTWTNDDMPELGGGTSLETCLAEAGQAGYAGIELGVKFPRDAGRLRPLLAAHGLDLISGWYGARLLERDAAAELAALTDHLNLLVEMECPVMVFAEMTGAVFAMPEAPLSTRPELSDSQWKWFGERLTAVGDELDRRGIRLAFHHHMGTVIQSESDVDRLMEVTGESVGLLFDSGHMAFAGGDPLGVVRRHGGRICHVHCKDVRGAMLERAIGEDRGFTDSVLDGVFTVPGDGSLDFAELLSALDEQGYDGWLVVEADQDPAKADPLTFARRGYDTLAAAAAVRFKS